MRQLVYFAHKIQASKVEHYKFLAQVQGHELKTNFEESGVELSGEQQKKVDSYLDKMNAKIKQGRENG